MGDCGLPATAEAGRKRRRGSGTSGVVCRHLGGDQAHACQARRVNQGVVGEGMQGRHHGEKGREGGIMAKKGSPATGHGGGGCCPTRFPLFPVPALTATLPWPLAAQEYFQGVGGVVGILLALTGSTLPGSEVVVAEGNGLGRGPVLFHVPQAVVTQVHKLAEAGDGAAQQVQARVQASWLVKGGVMWRLGALSDMIVRLVNNPRYSSPCLTG